MRSDADDRGSSWRSGHAGDLGTQGMTVAALSRGPADRSSASAAGGGRGAALSRGRRPGCGAEGFAVAVRADLQWQAAEPLSVNDFPASGMNVHA